MAYSYFIKQDSYNKFYKNFWTDYFVYQYKASPLKSAAESFESEFKVQGSDALMPYTTWSEYRKRLGNVLSRNYPNSPFIEIYPEAVPDGSHGDVSEIKSFKEIMQHREIKSDGGAHFVTWDSRNLRDNPFHSTYRCCKPGAFSRYFKLLYYSDMVNKAQGIVKFRKTTPNAILKDVDIKTFIEPEENDISETDSKKQPPMDSFRDSLYYYESIGILEHCGGKRSGQWTVPKTTINDFFAGTDYEDDLINALQFFSNIMPFGSVGCNLLQRLNINSTTGCPIVQSPAKPKKIVVGQRIEPEEKNNDIFRYKHRFASQALNDYNLIDLLYSIENSKWCRIEYRHPIRMDLKTFICYPIQIRSSADDGRQYIFCFEPTRHSLSSIRVDQIESVTPLSSVSCKADSGFMSRLCGGKNKYKISSDELTDLYKEEIENSKEWINYCWGASAFTIGSKVKKPKPKHLKITFSFDPKKEQHIVNRLKRERRFGAEPTIDRENGIATFEIDVLDVKELNKWIKSYYRRVHISSIEPVSSATRIMDDFLSVADTYRTHKLIGSPGRDSSGELKIPDEITVNISKSFHHHIFNEFMSDSSVYMIRSLYSKNWKSDDWFKADCNSGVEDLTSFFRGKSLPAKSFKELYCSFIPLLEIEKRWLLSVLRHPLIELFFDSDKIEPVIERLVENGVRELISSETVCVFGEHSDMDQFFHNRERKEEYIRFLRIILNAVRNNKRIRVSYKRGNIRKTLFPLRLEYSLREKRFRAMCCDPENGSISPYNIERFDDVNSCDSDTEKIAECCRTAEQRINLLNLHMENQQRYTVVRFTDGRNTADRLLNEFSSYRKCCTKDRHSKTYTMVLWFDGSDSKDIAIRIMSYGAYAEADGDEKGDSTVRREILARLGDQENLNRKLDSIKITQTGDVQ